MGFLDKVKSAAKDAWQESRQEDALEVDRASLDEEIAEIQRDGRHVFAPGEDVLLALVQGGGGATEGDTVGKLLSAANEAANPTVDLDIEGEGQAQRWPDGSNRLVVLTEKRLFVLQRRERLKEEHVEAAWWVHDVEDMTAGERFGKGTLQVTFGDGSVVRTPVSGYAEHVDEIWRTRPLPGSRPDNLDPLTYD